MANTERQLAARDFAARWAGQGDEKQQTQVFWLDLLRSVFGVADAERYILFEEPVRVDDLRTGRTTTKFIDGYIPETKVLIEQKSIGIDLSQDEVQSDGARLRPYQQARRYGGYMGKDRQPRWIVVCNFRSFEIHDMNRPNDEPQVLALADLERDVRRLQFLVDETDENIQAEMKLSLRAGEIVGMLYDALLEQYNDPASPETLKSLNALCVRLVFCLYAEDADIFGRHGMFHDYLRGYAVKDVRSALLELFRILDTPPRRGTLIWTSRCWRSPMSTAVCSPMRASSSPVSLRRSWTCCCARPARTSTGLRSALPSSARYLKAP